MQILVLEDHFALRAELTSLIESMGHQVCAVDNANDAIEVLKVVPTDAVITDVYVQKDGEYMPEGGVHLLGAIRFAKQSGLKISRRAPVLVISGGREIPGGFSPLRTARDLGADFCMRKPLDLDELAVWIMDTEIMLASTLNPPKP
jgi:CheY-like chemotaxis protein